MSELKYKDTIRWDPDLAFREHQLPNPFPRRISHSDVDWTELVGYLEVEINTQFLDVEGKRDGELISKGQRLLLDAKVRDGRTCIVWWGVPPTDIHRMQVWPREPFPATVFDYWRLCMQWIRWAEKQRRPIIERPRFKFLSREEDVMTPEEVRREYDRFLDDDGGGGDVGAPRRQHA